MVPSVNKKCISVCGQFADYVMPDVGYLFSALSRCDVAMPSNWLGVELHIRNNLTLLSI
jgi:hypothetical protein